MKSREVLAVAQEVLLDVERPVAQAEHEAPEPEVVVRLHDVPEDRPPADVDQRLRHRVGDVADPGTHAAAQDDHRDVGHRQILRSSRFPHRPTRGTDVPARIRGATDVSDRTREVTRQRCSRRRRRSWRRDHVVPSTAPRSRSVAVDGPRPRRGRNPAPAGHRPRPPRTARAGTASSRESVRSAGRCRPSRPAPSARRHPSSTDRQTSRAPATPRPRRSRSDRGRDHTCARLPSSSARASRPGPRSERSGREPAAAVPARRTRERRAPRSPSPVGSTSSFRSKLRTFEATTLRPSRTRSSNGTARNRSRYRSRFSRRGVFVDHPVAGCARHRLEVARRCRRRASAAAGRASPDGTPQDAVQLPVTASTYRQRVAGPLDEVVLVHRRDRDAVRVLHQQVREIVRAAAAQHPEDEDRPDGGLHRWILVARGRSAAIIRPITGRRSDGLGPDPQVRQPGPDRAAAGSDEYPDRPRALHGPVSRRIAEPGEVGHNGPGRGEHDVELRDLRVALRRHWFAATAAFLVCMLVGVYVAYSAAKTYEATATLSVQPNPTVSGGGQGGVQAANFIIPTVVAELKSSPYRDLASDALPDQYANRRVEGERQRRNRHRHRQGQRRGRRPARPRSTGPMRSPRSRRTIPARATGFVSVKIIEPATHAKAATGSDKTALLIASAVLGLLAAVFVALIASRTRRALDPTVEARARLHLPVLATIPRVRALRKRPLRPLMTSKSIPDLEESFRQLAHRDRAHLPARAPGRDRGDLVRRGRGQDHGHRRPRRRAGVRRPRRRPPRQRPAAARPCTPRSVCRSVRRASPSGPAGTATRSCGAAKSNNSATSPQARRTGTRPT